MKFQRGADLFSQLQSPPSRGAWIEMKLTRADFEEIEVAPLAGGVD